MRSTPSPHRGASHILAWVDKRWVSSPQSLLRGWHDLAHYGLVVVGALIAVYAVRVFTQALGGALEGYLGLGRAHSAAAFVSVILYGVVSMLAITGAGFDLSGLLVGGALTGVIVGIAAQASLSNIIAGVVILFARPCTVGLYVTVRANTFSGVEYSGQVRDVGLSLCVYPCCPLRYNSIPLLSEKQPGIVRVSARQPC
jgi:small-conductance mechanosensitive channel